MGGTLGSGYIPFFPLTKGTFESMIFRTSPGGIYHFPVWYLLY